MSKPQPEMWTTTDVANYLGVQVGTVSSYRQRQQMPSPDATYGRTPLWKAQTIIEWRAPAVRSGSPGGSTPERKPGEWLIGRERLLYDNEWVRLSLVEVDPPVGEAFDHHVITTHEAAICLVLDEAQEKAAMSWRHRFASDVWNWELPGGLVDEGEEPAATAIREVAEELCITVGEAEHLVSYEPNIGMMRGTHHVYRAVATSTAPTGAADPNEVGQLGWVPLTDVPQLIADGKVLSSGTLVALLHHLRAAEAQ